MRGMSRIYLSYDPEQRLLLPPDLREWLPEGHLALFISDVVDELDLSAIEIFLRNLDTRVSKSYDGATRLNRRVYGFAGTRPAFPPEPPAVRRSSQDAKNKRIFCSPEG